MELSHSQKFEIKFDDGTTVELNKSEARKLYDELKIIFGEPYVSLGNMPVMQPIAPPSPLG